MLHNVEGVTSHHRAECPPSVYSAVNGYENHFHGKILSVTDLIRGTDLKEEIESFETSMRNGDLQGYCDHMRNICEDKEEQQLWSFMKVEYEKNDSCLVYVR